MAVNHLLDVGSHVLQGNLSDLSFSSSYSYRHGHAYGFANPVDLPSVAGYPYFFSSCSTCETLAPPPPRAQFARPAPFVAKPVTSAVDSTLPPAGITIGGNGVGDRLAGSTVEVPPQREQAPVSLVINQVGFDFREGAIGTFQIQLNQAPTADVTLTFKGGTFLVVDADGDPKNGVQSSITITAQTWQQPRTVWFIAENDDSSADRTTGNTICYSLSGGVTLNGTYDLGAIANTYAPDPTRFNIDLDFRNDFLGFWTPERQAIAQQAANTWAAWIANRWTGFQLNHSIGLLDNGFPSQATFSTKRYVDDIVVFVNSINSGGLVGGYGGPEYQFGGWANPDGTGSMPRVGQIAIDTAIGDTFLYNAVLHELGHVLGLVGMNWAGYLQQDLTTPETATFRGYYSTLFNGGNPIPLQSQEGPNSITGTYNYYHPASQVFSVMSYGWLYSVTAPTVIDVAMLADSGYQIYGINA